VRNIVNKSKEKYRTIFENTGTATIIVEEDTTISLVNGQFEELSGYSREEIEWKKSWIEFVIEEDLERMKKLHYSRRKVPDSTLKKYEFRLVNKEGNIRDILIVIDLIRGTKKSVASLLDITDRKKAEEMIKKEVEKSKNYLNIAGVVIVALDIEGNITLLNKKGHNILQYNEGELIGKNWFKTCLPKRHRQSTLETFKKLIQGKLELVEFYDNPLLTKNGDEKIISWHNSLLYDSNGNIVGTLSSGEDITERKKAEEKLKESEEKYKYLFDSAQVGLYWSRISDGNFLECNDTFAKLFGYDTRKEFLANYNAIEHYINPNARSELLEEIRNNKEVKSYEIHVTKRDGSPIWVSISARMFETENRIEGAAIDITEHKIAEEKILESEEKYREAYNRAEFYKDLFAHDINNILQSILSGIQVSQIIFDNHEESADLKLNAEIIKEQVIRGARLVSNVRKISKLEEAGRSLEKIEIFNVLENSVSFVKKTYKDKNLAILVDSIGEKLFIKANIFLEDVFENLLFNAIRHNRNLMIEIFVRISRERNVDVSYLKMEFIDNGLGVADSMKGEIFQRGYSKDKGVYGRGLGLSLVRGIIETYNGKIWVEDRVKGDRSKGSNFVLLIPEVD